MIVLCIFDDVWLLNLFRCETNTLLYCILNRNLVITRLISLCQDTHTMMTRFTSFFSKIQYTNNCKTIIKISSNDNWSTLVANIKTFFCRAIAPTTQDQMMPRTASNRSRKRAGWHKSARNSPTSWVLSYSSLGRCLPGQ